jgi:hypothetical protein
MNDPDWRQRVTFQDFVEAGPSDHALAISPRQLLLPPTHDLSGVPSQSSNVATNAIVGIVAPQHGGQMAMLIADRPMPVLPAPVVRRSHRASKAAFGRDLPNHVASSP